MALALSAALALTGEWDAMSLPVRIGLLAALVSGGAAIYFAVCYLVGLRLSELRIQSGA